MLNQCLDFSSLVDDFIAVKDRRGPFWIFHYILSNEKQRITKKNSLVSTEVPRLVIHPFYRCTIIIFRILTSSFEHQNTIVAHVKSVNSFLFIQTLINKYITKGHSTLRAKSKTGRTTWLFFQHNRQILDYFTCLEKYCLPLAISDDSSNLYFWTGCHACFATEDFFFELDLKTVGHVHKLLSLTCIAQTALTSKTVNFRRQRVSPDQSSLCGYIILDNVLGYFCIVPHSTKKGSF